MRHFFDCNHYKPLDIPPSIKIDIPVIYLQLSEASQMATDAVSERLFYQ